jgi:hypothetical protein
MKISIHKIAKRSFLIIFMFFSILNASANQGNITFSGLVVNNSCTTTTNSNNYEITCHLDGSSKRFRYENKKLNFTTGMVSSVKWLDSSRSKGIVNVVYF